MAVDIMGLFGRTGGISQNRHPNRQEYRLQDMRRRAVVAGLPLNQRSGRPTPHRLRMQSLPRKPLAATGKLVNALTRSCWADEKTSPKTT
jgi:2-hydroxychromene-2-carboxylate isomerase